MEHSAILLSMVALLTGCAAPGGGNWEALLAPSASYQPTQECHRDADGLPPSRQVVAACDFQASAATTEIDDGTIFNLGRGVNMGVLITKCLRAKGYPVWEDAPGKYCPAHAVWRGWGDIDYLYDARLNMNVENPAAY